jgi:hypothetical protein
VTTRTATCLAIGCLTVFLAACGSTGSPTASTAAPLASPAQASQAAAETEAPSAAVGTGSVSPQAGTSGFPFTADGIVGFYESQGLDCAAAVPSTVAAGWLVRTCQGLDPAGRRFAVGVVTDPEGVLGGGFASVTALPEEELLEPTDALDDLSGFLGAMLGEDQATGQLRWLAGHLGDDYAETTAGDVTIATYIESEDDPTRIYLEIAGPEYAAASSR